MRIHILGICGTFMAGLAILARQLGHEVSGCDQAVYPPMSEQLEAEGIALQHGYSAKDLPTGVDCFVIGNALSRGNDCVEAIMANHLAYTSGPQWLAEQVLAKRKVVAVAGTHGKTTTTSMLTWILQTANLKPGFLIGGVAANFAASADNGKGEVFVIEADEYDTAFFDKRSKFLHYHPQILIINNVEYDHADIFPNLAAIQSTFALCIRTVPRNGLIIYPQQDPNITEVLQQGCWSPTETFGLQQGEWQVRDLAPDASEFTITHRGNDFCHLRWPLCGLHNVHNALAAAIAANNLGVTADTIAVALNNFAGVKRRLEKKAEIAGITVYDDFAHHPTAIATTLDGLRKKVGQKRIIVILDFASNSMRSGIHSGKIAAAMSQADIAYLAKPADVSWDFAAMLQQFKQQTCVLDNVDAIVANVQQQAKAGDHIIVMSNKSFDGLTKKLIQAIS